MLDIPIFSTSTISASNQVSLSPNGETSRRPLIRQRPLSKHNSAVGDTRNGIRLLSNATILTRRSGRSRKPYKTSGSATRSARSASQGLKCSTTTTTGNGSMLKLPRGLVPSTMLLPLPLPLLPINNSSAFKTSTTSPTSSSRKGRWIEVILSKSWIQTVLFGRLDNILGSRLA